MNIDIQKCSMWLINLHSRQNGGDDYVNRREIFLTNLMNTGNTLEGDVSDVIALDQLTSPFSPRKATKMSP